MPIIAIRFADAGVAALLFTDVGRDGLLRGCNVAATQAPRRGAPRIPVIASGGVARTSPTSTRSPPRAPIWVDASRASSLAARSTMGTLDLKAALTIA